MQFTRLRGSGRRENRRGYQEWPSPTQPSPAQPASQPASQPAQPRPFCGRPPNTAPATKIRRPRRGVWGGLKRYLGSNTLIRYCIGALGGEARWGHKVAAGGWENRGPTGSGATSAWLGGFRVETGVPGRLRELSGSFSGCFRSSKSVLGALGGAFRCHVRLQNGSSRRHLARRRMDACMGRSTKHACALGIHNQTHTRWLR